VLFIDDGSTVVTGKPIIDGAKVLATSQGDIRGEKTTAFKYKNKTRYHRKIGHRERYSKLAIDKIIVPEGIKTGKD
jgi:large subunit ribosomal protein L21